MHTGLPPADSLDLGFRASHVVHVGCRASDVADDPLEIFVLTHLSDLVENRFFGARLDDSTLMGSDRAESTTAKATAHDRHRVLDHVEGWDRLTVTRVSFTRIRQSVDSIHRFLADGQSRHVAHDSLIAMALDQASCIERIGFMVDHSRGDRE